MRTLPRQRLVCASVQRTPRAEHIQHCNNAFVQAATECACAHLFEVWKGRSFMGMLNMFAYRQVVSISMVSLLAAMGTSCGLPGSIRWSKLATMRSTSSGLARIACTALRTPHRRTTSAPTIFCVGVRRTPRVERMQHCNIACVQAATDCAYAHLFEISQR